MPKYKVQSGTLNCVFECEKELDFSEAVAFALERDRPEELGLFVSVKKYGRRPGSDRRYASTQPILEELGLWSTEEVVVEKPARSAEDAPDGYNPKRTGTVSTGDMIYSKWAGGKWIETPEKFVGRDASVFHKVATPAVAP